MLGGFDPTRPIAPAFTKLSPHIDISQPGAGKKGAPRAGGLIRTAAMAVAMGRKAPPPTGGK